MKKNNNWLSVASLQLLTLVVLLCHSLSASLAPKNKEIFSNEDLIRMSEQAQIALGIKKPLTTIIDAQENEEYDGQVRFNRIYLSPVLCRRSIGYTKGVIFHEATHAAGNHYLKGMIACYLAGGLAGCTSIYLIEQWFNQLGTIPAVTISGIASFFTIKGLGSYLTKHHETEADTTAVLSLKCYKCVEEFVHDSQYIKNNDPRRGYLSPSEKSELGKSFGQTVCALHLAQQQQN